MSRPTSRSPVLASSLAVNLLIALALATGLLRQAMIPGAEAARELPPVRAKAFARVDFSGDDLIDKAHSRNVRRLEFVTTGFYCLHLDVTVKNVVASPLSGAGNSSVFVAVGLVGPDGDIGCSDGADVYVLIRNGGDPVNSNFYVVMH